MAAATMTVAPRCRRYIGPPSRQYYPKARPLSSGSRAGWRNFGDLQIQQRSALAAYQPAVRQRIDRRRIALDAGDCGIGRLRQRIGRLDARQLPPGKVSHRLKRRAALAAYMVEAA